jgi:hypothetical protein
MTIKEIRNDIEMRQGYRWVDDNHALVSPLFWQTLGHVREWTETYMKFNADGTDTMMGRWWKEMHNFIDHLASGSDAESFFADLK